MIANMDEFTLNQVFVRNDILVMCLALRNQSVTS